MLLSVLEVINFTARVAVEARIKGHVLIVFLVTISRIDVTLFYLWLKPLNFMFTRSNLKCRDFPLKYFLFNLRLLFEYHWTICEYNLTICKYHLTICENHLTTLLVVLICSSRQLQCHLGWEGWPPSYQILGSRVCSSPLTVEWRKSWW